MVDKLFNKVFTVMDSSQAAVTNLLTGKESDHIVLGANSQKKPVDKTLCIIHKLKKSFFCEDCCFELCITCKERHEQGHAVKFTEESAQFVMDKFEQSLENLKEMRIKVHEAASQDPSQFPPPEGQANILEQGGQEIDRIFERIQKSIDQTKQEMKDRLKEAYKANYRATIDSKSQSYFTQLDKLENYVNACLQDWTKKQEKGKLVVICAQRPKVDELYVNLDKFSKAFVRMCEKSREFRNEFQIQFRQPDFENGFKELLNNHMSVSFPGLEHGFFQGVKKTLSMGKNFSDRSMEKQNRSVEIMENKKNISGEFDPLRSLEEEEYDIRKAKEFVQATPQISTIKPILVDTKYELRTLKFKKDKFEVKTYDAINKKGSTVAILIPDEYRRIATKNFGYVNLGKDLLMCGGQFLDDKTCSLDTYLVNPLTGDLQDLKCNMKQARMHHSMIYIEEKQVVLMVGGEDENGNILDSCECYDTRDNFWKVVNTLNQKQKNIGLCKFTRDNKKEKCLYVYAFGKYYIERCNFMKPNIDLKWEKLDVKGFLPFNPGPMTLQFDENVIVVMGGNDEKNQFTVYQDVVIFNHQINAMEKSSLTQLSVCDKFLGGAMTQFVNNRIESKIYFCSESFVHEMEYGIKTGEAKFKFKANLY